MDKQFKVLVIGLGNIGALYDFHTEAITSHVKGFVLHGSFDVSVYDANRELADKVALKYALTIAEEPTVQSMKQYDVVCICTPTHTHYQYLSAALSAQVKLVVCEKPVSMKQEEIAALTEQYNSGTTKVLVNYIRRFCPAYHALRNEMTASLATEPVSQVAIRYYRGFLNNSSHAFDLLQFLTGKQTVFTEWQPLYSVNDHFKDDPTISAYTKWNDIPCYITGLTNIQYPQFEIDIYFAAKKIEIRDSGNSINMLAKVNHDSPFVTQHIETKAINNYMVHVVSKVYNILSGDTTTDNFMESVTLNSSMLKLLINNGEAGN